MKNYVNSSFIGIGIASFVMVVYACPYFGLKLLMTSLALGICQGLIVPLIYRTRIKSPYIIKVLLHAMISYGVVVLWYLSGPNLSFIKVSIVWLMIFVVVFSYFYYINHTDAGKLNQLLKEGKHED